MRRADGVPPAPRVRDRGERQERGVCGGRRAHPVVRADALQLSSHGEGLKRNTFRDYASEAEVSDVTSSANSSTHATTARSRIIRWLFPWFLKQLCILELPARRQRTRVLVMSPPTRQRRRSAEDVFLFIHAKHARARGESAKPRRRLARRERRRERRGRREELHERERVAAHARGRTRYRGEVPFACGEDARDANARARAVCTFVLGPSRLGRSSASACRRGADAASAASADRTAAEDAAAQRRDGSATRARRRRARARGGPRRRREPENPPRWRSAESASAAERERCLRTARRRAPLPPRATTTESRRRFDVGSEERRTSASRSVVARCCPRAASQKVWRRTRSSRTSDRRRELQSRRARSLILSPGAARRSPQHPDGSRPRRALAGAPLVSSSTPRAPVRRDGPPTWSERRGTPRAARGRDDASPLRAVVASVERRRAVANPRASARAHRRRASARARRSRRNDARDGKIFITPTRASAAVESVVEAAVCLSSAAPRRRGLAPRRAYAVVGGGGVGEVADDGTSRGVERRERCASADDVSLPRALAAPQRNPRTPGWRAPPSAAAARPPPPRAAAYVVAKSFVEPAER